MPYAKIFLNLLKNLSRTAHVFKKILLFIFPPSCYGCDCILNKFSYFCDDCDGRIMPVTTAYISMLGKKIPVIAASNYDYPLKKLILAKQYKQYRSAQIAGEIIWQKTVLKNLNFDIIVPVPLHVTRRYLRGYNQSEEIAKIISKHSGKPMIKALKRNKKTKFQSLLNKIERSENLKDAFKVKNPSVLNGKIVLLVDDLMTTGATLQSACKVLTGQSHLENIICVVTCRVI